MASRQSEEPDDTTKAEGIRLGKSRLRTDTIRTRDEISQVSREESSRLICKRIFEMQVWKEAQGLAAFVGFGSEPDTSKLLTESFHAQKSVYLPKVVSKSELGFGRVTSFHQLHRGAYGILEPNETVELSPLADLDLSLVIVPGVAFDHRCNRLGYGRGYYDRSLAQLLARRPVRLVGACFHELVQPPNRIPLDTFDVPVHEVVTQQCVIHPGPAPARTPAP